MIRVGLIGCGRILVRAHSLGYRVALDEGLIQIAALSDLSDESRARAGATYTVPEAQRYADYRDMLAKAPIDAVVIATPHSVHAEQAIASAEAGKAVISEKPMAVTLEDADAIVGAVKRHRVPYAVVHNFLFTQGALGAAALLKEGSLGKPLVGRGEMLANKPEEATRVEADWRNSAAAGGGALNDSSYHEIYTVETLMGSPVKYVEARIATLKFPFDVDDTALMTFEHESGALSTVQAAWCVRSPSNRGRWVSVNTTEGGVRVVVNDASPLSRALGEGNWESVDPQTVPGVPAPIPDDRTGHAAFFRATFTALDQGKPLPVTVDDAHRNIAIIDAARRASATRRAVEVK
ncbi:MAG TPA: Gfo/Idh/MocA family oxidoreductase [Chloroflexota bacterium]|nr:Gfo/Idh/MocA family oxidoreductase [Chloroflexota bacterium]